MTENSSASLRSTQYVAVSGFCDDSKAAFRPPNYGGGGGEGEESLPTLGHTNFQKVLLFGCKTRHDAKESFASPPHF